MIHLGQSRVSDPVGPCPSTWEAKTLESLIGELKTVDRRRVTTGNRKAFRAKVEAVAPAIKKAAATTTLRDIAEAHDISLKVVRRLVSEDE
jgi:hypothetical protein